MALQIGIDLVAVATVVESLEGAHRDHYLERVYTAREIGDCRGPDGQLEPQRLAARFAAKEAAIKALPGAGEGIPLTQIEVVRGESGQPTLKLTGRAATAFAASGANELAVSLSHEDGYAVATVATV